MRLVPISELKTNSTSAISVVDGSGRFLIKENEKFSARGIETLKKLNIKFVYITDHFCFNEGNKMYNVESEVLDTCMSKLRYIGERTAKGITDRSDMDSVFTISKTIVENIIENKDIFEIAYQPNRFVENTIVEESIYVAIMSTVLAVKLDWNEERVLNTCISALLKDFGLLSPKISFDSKVNYQLHPKYSYEFLKNKYDLHEEIMYGVLHHHEYNDQTGYPNKLAGKDISDIGKVIALITFFYEIRMNHNPLFDMSGSLENKFKFIQKKFDSHIYDIFMKNVSLFTLDTIIQLNTLDVGVILENNIGNPYRPIVKIIKGSRYKVNDVINLSEKTTVTIEKIRYYI